MSMISGRIVSCVSYDCRLLVNSLDWAFDLASLSGTALAASILCWTTGILHFVAGLDSEIS